MEIPLMDVEVSHLREWTSLISNIREPGVKSNYQNSQISDYCRILYFQFWRNFQVSSHLKDFMQQILWNWKKELQLSQKGNGEKVNLVSNSVCSHTNRSNDKAGDTSANYRIRIELVLF